MLQRSARSVFCKPDVLWRKASCRSLLICALSLLAVCFALPSAPVEAQRRAPGSRAVVFAVWPDEDGPRLDPVVMVERGRLARLPYNLEQENTPAMRRFIAEYYRPGRRYRLLFGGGEAGTATVRRYEEPACVGLMAQAQLETSARLGGMVHALATDSTTLGRHASARRAPTETERAAMMELVRRNYRQRRVPAAATNNLRALNLTAIDINDDGQFELIGSFLAGNLSNNTPEHALFLVAEPQGNSFRAAHVWYHRTPPTDEASAQMQNFVDHLDLDGDGVAEIVTRILYYESWDYHIYKRQGSVWRRIYTGGGGGC